MSPTSGRRRRSIRLPGYDYTQPGAYFVTICTYQQEPLFGEVVGEKMQLNQFGEIVREEWFRTADLRPYVRLNDDELVIMPNHLHGIIWIVDNVGARRRRAPTAQPFDRPDARVQFRCAPTTEQFGKPVSGSIPTIIRSFKSAVTHRINQLRGTPGAPVWQRNYWEHIVRDEQALDAIRRYIRDNPLRWSLDRYNPNATGQDPLARDIWLLIRRSPLSQQEGGRP